MRARLRVATSPESASCSPASTASSVDLPAPFGPIRPMRSPSDTGKLISSKRGTAPNRFDRPCALRIGGIASVYRAGPGGLVEVEVAEGAVGERLLLGLLDGFGELLGHQVVLVLLRVDGLGEDGVAACVGFARGAGGVGEVLEH